MVRFGPAVFRRTISERYPTRTVEHMLGWVVLVWSASVIWLSPVLKSAEYEFLRAVMPLGIWGAIGVMLGFSRLLALFINGNWRRTPGMRLVCAATGLIWWLILSALYWAAVQKGALDFPMRYVLPVFIAFEAYSCFRCGQDLSSMPQAPRAGASGSTDVAGHG